MVKTMAGFTPQSPDKELRPLTHPLSAVPYHRAPPQPPVDNSKLIHIHMNEIYLN